MHTERIILSYFTYKQHFWSNEEKLEIVHLYLAKEINLRNFPLGLKSLKKLMQGVHEIIFPEILFCIFHNLLVPKSNVFNIYFELFLFVSAIKGLRLKVACEKFLKLTLKILKKGNNSVGNSGCNPEMGNSSR